MLGVIPGEAGSKLWFAIYMYTGLNGRAFGTRPRAKTPATYKVEPSSLKSISHHDRLARTNTRTPSLERRSLLPILGLSIVLVAGL